MALITVTKTGTSLKVLANKFGRVGPNLHKRFGLRLKKDSEKSVENIKRSLKKISPGSRRTLRLNPLRVALAAPRGTTPNNDLGKLHASIGKTVNGINSEIGTKGAFDNGENYANTHEDGSRKYILPEKGNFDKKTQKSADIVMKKLSELR